MNDGLFDFFSTDPSWFGKLSVSRIIFLVKIGLLSAGVYRFIEAFYLLFGQDPDTDFTTFISQSLIAMAVVFACAVITALVCTHIYKYVRDILES